MSTLRTIHKWQTEKGRTDEDIINAICMLSDNLRIRMAVKEICKRDD